MAIGVQAMMLKDSVAEVGAFETLRKVSSFSPAGVVAPARATVGLIPAVAALIAMVILWKYPLTDQRFRAIRNETELRKRQEGHVTPDGHVLD